MGENKLKLPSLEQIIAGLPAYPVELRLEDPSKMVLIGAASILAAGLLLGALINSNKI